MTSPWRRILLAAVVLVGMAWLLRGQREPATPVLGAETLEAKGELKWYRGNIHTHSLWSDGDDYPEMIAAWYKEKGYNFLAFTDHNILHDKERWTDVEQNKGKRTAYDKLKQKFGDDWVEERQTNGKLEVRLKRLDEVRGRLAEPEKFLLIQGEEISDSFQRLPIHINATNIKELIPPLHGESVADTIQNNVSAVIAQRERTGQDMLIHLNHPNFGYAVTAEDMMQIRGEKFFEVYNGHPGVHNSGDQQHASTERIWDIVLAKRLGEFNLPVMYGLATDDGHNYHNIPSRASEPGRGWIMVLADALTPQRLIRAMEAGQFYSSSGVSLTKVVSSPKGLEVNVLPDQEASYTIEFIGTRRTANLEGRPVLDKDGKPVRTTQIYSKDIGEVLKTVQGTSASYQFQGNELYVRARIDSSRKHPNPSEPGEIEHAWTQPVVGPGALAHQPSASN
jgi:hypothetical protein